MATRMLDVLQTKGTHEIGKITNLAKHTTTVPLGGVITTADVDNFLPAVDDGYSADGDKQVKLVDDNTAAGRYLVFTPEFRPLGGHLEDFYNKVGDKASLAIMKPQITRFLTSAFTLNSGVSAVAKGLVAHFDIATKKYILSDAGSAHTDYAASGTKYEVVLDLDDTTGLYNSDVVGLMVIAN